AIAQPAAADFSGAEIVHLLSLQREANGIPGALAERSEWSAGCAKHNYYEAQTGEFGHEEDPSSPYYSLEGDLAARSSVIAYGRSWSSGNPWEEAPIHLLQMLAPQLSETGAAESYGRNCLTTWPGYKRPSPATLTGYSYPGNGVSGVVPTERASESPFIPGDFVGLPEGTATGRYLLAYLSGPLDFARADEVTATASLLGPNGPVDLRAIDSTSPDIGAFMPRPSAFLIPVQPLQPLTAYRAIVNWSLSGQALYEQRFGFTTGTDASQSAAANRTRRNSCARLSRSARSLRRRSAKLRARGALLVRASSTKVEQKKGRRLLTRAGRLRAKARHRAKQAKHCSGARSGPS
ncbi:MAG TPA: hypothetical protein VJQ84_01250, partial [Solirubrobacterales bacterium]|nr:hypothetical protein [Solirubrobacterales bacterium]